MVNFPIWIPNCDSHSPALLDLFLPSDASICSAMTFLHPEILIILLSQFPLNFSYTKLDAPFHRIAYNYSHRNVSWEDIFKLSPSVPATELCEWAQVEIDVYFPHGKYQFKSHSSPWFSAACAKHSS